VVEDQSRRGTTVSDQKPDPETIDLLLQTINKMQSDYKRLLAEAEIWHTASQSSVKQIVELRELLKLFLGAMRCSAPQFGGTLRWTMHAQGWPWNHAVGNTAEQAAFAVLAEVKRAWKKEQTQ
jgi:hypothetical protein